MRQVLQTIHCQVSTTKARFFCGLVALRSASGLNCYTPELRRLSGIDPSTTEPRLQNKILFVPLFTADAFFFKIVCFIDVVYFALGTDTIHVSATPSSSVDIVFSGSATRPAIVCENAPNVNLNKLQIKISLEPSVSNGRLILNLRGQFLTEDDVTGVFGGIIDAFADIGGRIRNEGTNALNAALDGPTKAVLNDVIIRSIIEPYIRNTTGRSLGQVLSVVVGQQGLALTYFPAP